MPAGPSLALPLFGRSDVGSQLARDLPDPFRRVELGRVARQPVQFQLVGVRNEPLLPRVIEPMTGPVVDDEEELAGGVLGNELLEKLRRRCGR